MKAEGVSRGLVSNDLLVERQESAGKGEEDFRVLLEARSQMATRFSPDQEPLSGPMCSSGCTDFSSFGAVDSGKGAKVYEKNAVLYRPSQSETAPAELESGPSINVQVISHSSFEMEKTTAELRNESTAAPGSMGGFFHVLAGIKGFFVRLFSPPVSSSASFEPPARVEVPDTGSTESDGSVTRFLHWVGTILSFGLWRPGESQESGKTCEEALGKASGGRNDPGEHNRLASASSRQNLPVETGQSAGDGLGGVHANINLKVPGKIREAIQQAARKYDLSAELIAAVIKVESNFDPGAISKEGAGGLMQLMPSTARALRVGDRFDIQQNIDAGSRYLKDLLERFGGQVELALAAYNVGPETVERYNGVPPYRQTRHYVRKVLAHC